jgi:hypothetical protein
MINKEEIEKAAREYNKKTDEANNEWVAEDFVAGIIFAKSKLKEIAIEFGRFAYDHYEDSYLSFEELFELFLKKRNENNK